jgi:hypothetical protein
MTIGDIQPVLGFTPEQIMFACRLIGKNVLVICPDPSSETPFIVRCGGCGSVVPAGDDICTACRTHWAYVAAQSSFPGADFIGLYGMLIDERPSLRWFVGLGSWSQQDPSSGAWHPVEQLPYKALWGRYQEEFDERKENKFQFRLVLPWVNCNVNWPPEELRNPDMPSEQLLALRIVQDQVMVADMSNPLDLSLTCGHCSRQVSYQDDACPNCKTHFAFHVIDAKTYRQEGGNLRDLRFELASIFTAYHPLIGWGKARRDQEAGTRRIVIQEFWTDGRNGA